MQGESERSIIAPPSHRPLDTRLEEDAFLFQKASPLAHVPIQTGRYYTVYAAAHCALNPREKFVGLTHLL